MKRNWIIMTGSLEKNAVVPTLPKADMWHMKFDTSDIGEVQQFLRTLSQRINVLFC